MKALKQHWPEYLMEGGELAMFMISASLFTILLYHPASPVVRAFPSELFRRVLGPFEFPNKARIRESNSFSI